MTWTRRPRRRCAPRSSSVTGTARSGSGPSTPRSVAASGRSRRRRGTWRTWSARRSSRSGSTRRSATRPSVTPRRGRPCSTSTPRWSSGRGAFGVPTIVLDDGTGPAIFGPVVSELPSDEDTVSLWQHLSWLTRYTNFAELKRGRAVPPDLPTAAWYREQRAQGATRRRADHTGWVPRRQRRWISEMSRRPLGGRLVIQTSTDAGRRPGRHREDGLRPEVGPRHDGAGPRRRAWPVPGWPTCRSRRSTATRRCRR